FQYSDDLFGADRAFNICWYEPYHTLLPSKQVQLLYLWDELGIPHQHEKQLSGSSLTIIGFVVDANCLTISLDSAKWEELISFISWFCSLAPIKHPLKEFQRLARWINWILNIFPLLHSGLFSIYQKTADKDEANLYIYINNAICSDLHWLLAHLHRQQDLLILEDI
ncbi:hypothetical protein BDQ17DRAFT_1171017, partial [Cyathus striatus]